MLTCFVILTTEMGGTRSTCGKKRNAFTILVG